MSGAEFIAAAGVIASMIAIIDGIKQVVEAALDAEGLPKVFRRASHMLPIISDILVSAKSALDKKDALVERSIKLTIEDCEENWQKLKGLFDKVIPEDKTKPLDRYYKAVKTLGKGGKVETLMKEILESVQLLTSFKVLTAAKQEEVIKVDVAKEKLVKSITEVEAWESSVPDNVFEEGSYSLTVSGSGHIVAQGGNVKQSSFKDNSRQIKISGGHYYEGKSA
ncbi:hypothetical protein ABW20_dc0101973 [Dactylellina cionopaga]|nr:hypothetical protein ABW20_dc0101973 [Dactylellina cionopaga]